MKNSVLYYLERSEREYPNKIAVKDDSVSYTYSELYSLSKKAGSFISSITYKEPVIVFADKSAKVLAAFLGILYSGNFYSLVNPEFPINRIKSINNTLNSNLVITTREYYDKAKEVFNSKIVLLDDIFNYSVNNEVINERRNNIIDTFPVYVNFTSGSTGNPKGVVISNKSVLNFIDTFTSTFNISNNDIIANQAPFDFDVSVKDIYSSLCMGSTLVIVPKRLFSSPALLLDYLIDNKVTTLIWAVSALCLVTTFHGLDYKVPETINKIMFSGEVMPIKHLNEWMSKLPNALFVNLYGPTEITCNCLYHVIDKNKTYEHIPAGKPFINSEVFLLDPNNNIINEENVTGEICVKGSGLALGYYNNKEQTDKAFVINPNNNIYEEKIYRTGDLGKYKDGDIYFQGRKDFQIKYMGHRIELEEIELNINKIDNIHRSCCIFDNDKEKLYGFYIGDIDKKELRLNLNKLLPVFMIPSKLIKVEEFPLNKNGKIDRKELMKEVKK